MPTSASVSEVFLGINVKISEDCQIVGEDPDVMPPAKRVRRQRPARPSHPSYPSPHQRSWVDDTFISSDEAVTALCNDRFSFVMRGDIMTLVPGHIRLRMTHHDPSAHIPGFQELFIYVNNNQSATCLRQRIEDYFDNSPPLRENLSQSPFVSDDTNK